VGRDGDRDSGQGEWRDFSRPNTLGVLSPGKGVRRDDRGRAESARNGSSRHPVRVGVISRSGGMASSTGYYLRTVRRAHLTIAHIGGDAVLASYPGCSLMFQADPLTEAIVIFGEIGSSQKRELAQLIFK